MEKIVQKLQAAQFYKTLAKATVQCRLCNHFCTIKPGQVGICRTRKNIDGQLYSLDYGRPVAIHVDPIEKKPLYHFLPGSLTFSLGTLGCNFRCLNCQNYDISQTEVEKESAKLKWVEPMTLVQLAQKAKCSSLAYTYNEPTVFTEYALDIMKLAKKAHLKNVWVSNGFMSPEALREIIPHLDAINVDLKFMDNQHYQTNCGAKLEPILANLQTLKKAKVHLEITTLVIPTLSDKPEMFKKIAEFIKTKLGANTPWHLARFSPQIAWKLTDLPATEVKTLNQAYEIGRKAGLNYVYIDNVITPDKENTYCPKCQTLAIKRVVYQIQRFDKQGYCTKCQTSLDIL